jgi:L,D-peptidoglycan transpeptidase YkuD (ErfK/YbiS/YcfS/YnhG family)
MRFFPFLVLFFSVVPLPAFELPPGSTQCLVATAADWDSSRATLRLFERRGGEWRPVGGEWPARLGKSGLVWGLGLHPVPDGARIKREGDWRTPAGVFRIGGAWGNADDVARRAGMPYTKVTPRDLWVEDPGSPDYNRHIRLDGEPATAWEKKQQMKQDDPAHALKLFIGHNDGPKVVPGAGSAIFFHIWRADGAKPTAGCTTMSERDLRALIAALDPARKPLFVVLPESDYARLRGPWKLP